MKIKNEDIKGLLIQVDFSSGDRAGGINPKDPNLRCHGWQNLDTGWEVRLIEDDRDTSQYEGIDGVELLLGKNEVNKAIKSILPKKVDTEYIISNEAIMLKHMEERKISLNCLAEKGENKISLGELYESGIAGISKIEHSNKEIE